MIEDQLLAVKTAQQLLDKELSDLQIEKLDFDQSLSQLQNLRLKFLGKKGQITLIMRSMKSLDENERPRFGQLVNQCKLQAEEKIGKVQIQLEQQKIKAQIDKEHLDVSLPGYRRQPGSLHPVGILINRAQEVLKELGFSIQDAPEIDSEFFMFDALNFPKDHPARDMQDTFYLQDDLVLRSQTSNAQVRLMRAHSAPLRVATFGKCYRNEDVSARSLVSFHQIEALVIDHDICYGDLIFHLESFFERLLECKVELKVRLSYFPFVQPGIEVDIRCWFCKGKGCMTCKNSGWIEVCGAGMVHPHVLQSGKIDSDRYSGFAWGMGVERLVMLRYGIKDIRQLIQNDFRLLRQFQSQS